ncbi:glycosyltransferase, partial [Acinetobacter baumannii]
EIINRYSTDSRIKLYVNNINIGYNSNFEQALYKTNGDFIAFSDQDDVWNLEKIDTLYNEIGNYYLVYSNSELIDEQGNLLNKKLSDICIMQTT